MSYIGNEPIVSATRTVTEITATAGQTTFTANGGYTVGYIDVFVNGSQLTASDFTATNGSTITLNEAATVNDIVRLVAWGTFSTSNLVAPNYTGTLTGGTGVVNIGSGQFYKDASGNVGIGTSSPNSRLEVYQASSGDQNVLRIRTDATAGDAAYLTFDGSANSARARIGSRLTGGGNGQLVFETRDASTVTMTERMRIDSSGNLMVGTTSTYDNSKVTILSDSSFPNGLAIRTNGNNNAIAFWRNSTTYAGAITLSGSGTAYTSASDYRLKENIVPMTGALATVQQLKPCTYNWKADGSSGQGFIAHELQAVVPDCVTGEKDAVDEEGNPKYQGVDTSFLVATLTAAIQELKSIVDNQKIELDNAKAEIELLKGAN